jgi:site-specific DNA-methyltransferase (adenine-specific)
MCTLHCGDNLYIIPTLPNESIDCIITAPPLWQPHSVTLDEYPLAPHDCAFSKSAHEWRERLRKTIRLLRPKLKPDGSLWMIMSDSKGRGDTLTLDSFRLILNLQDDDWICRNVVMWTPPGQYAGLIWHMQKLGSKFTGSLPLHSSTAIPAPFKSNQVYQELPIDLVSLILTTQTPGTLICDPFSGFASVGEAALHDGFDYIGIEINPVWNAQAEKRLSALVHAST